jgi:hypothetical protein
MDVLISQESGILSKILEIKSINSDMFHSLSGLTGFLAIMTSFVEKRVLQCNMIEDAMICQITGTLSTIDKSLNEFKIMYEKSYVWSRTLSCGLHSVLCLEWGLVEF